MGVDVHPMNHGNPGLVGIQIAMNGLMNIPHFHTSCAAV